ncbi:hypothetical protein VM1G_05909 [Cytospora mali]|uniref:Uncharacterized protein n=1 Tax=Cytospora mali TaxID=578113 RepID=A0A194W2E3_CYTMA|nr:hypothetical protein VM1G_05909 [Valsa mali]
MRSADETTLIEPSSDMEHLDLYRLTLAYPEDIAGAVKVRALKYPKSGWMAVDIYSKWIYLRQSAKVGLEIVRSAI